MGTTGCFSFYPTKELGYQVGDLPVCDKATTEALSLPVYPDMKTGHIERIAQTILDALK